MLWLLVPLSLVCNEVQSFAKGSELSEIGEIPIPFYPVDLSVKRWLSQLHGVHVEDQTSYRAVRIVNIECRLLVAIKELEWLVPELLVNLDH